MIELLPSFQPARLSAAPVINLSSPVFIMLFQCIPTRCAVSGLHLRGHSADIDTLHIYHADILIGLQDA